MTRKTTAVVIVCCICSYFWIPTALAAEPMLDCLPEPEDRSGEQVGSAALIVANVGLGLFNANRQVWGESPNSAAWLGIVVGAGSVIYATAADPEFTMSVGISGAMGAAVGLFCLANGPKDQAQGRSSDRWSARVGPAVILPARGKTLVGVGLSAGF